MSHCRHQPETIIQNNCGSVSENLPQQIQNRMIQPTMKMKSFRSFLTLVLAAGLLPFSTHAQLKITEVESSESGALHSDWWELSNFGGSSVNLNGYKFNDSTGGATNQAVTITGLSIAPGESMIFTENTSPQGFRDWWGTNSTLTLSVQITTYVMSGIGLSSATDEVHLYDSNSNEVDSVTFGAATAGFSFLFDNSGPIGRSPTGNSVNGVNGAFASVQNGDIGSPGLVPEPATLALCGIGLSLFFFRRNLKK
jgi:Lamin Tail Domain/PEP-CTERM motif